MKKAAVILSGSGVFDGAEIHESVITLLALDRAGVSVEIFAPDIDQHHVINHMTGKEMNEKRNVLIEAARIARGEIKDLKDARYLQLKLKQLTREKKLLISIKGGKTFWKYNNK